MWLRGWGRREVGYHAEGWKTRVSGEEIMGRVFLGVPRVEYDEVWISSSGFSNREHGCYECSIEYGRILGIRYAINKSL